MNEYLHTSKRSNKGRVVSNKYRKEKRIDIRINIIRNIDSNIQMDELSEQKNKFNRASLKQIYEMMQK